MGTELVRSCIKEDDLDFPAIPPGFESFTSFKLKRAENSENENGCAVSSNLSEQPVPIQVEPDDKAGKISRSLRRRPWINYSQFDEACDDECNSEQLDQNFPVKPSLPKGVIRGCPACQNCQKVVARWHPEAACRPVLEDVPVFYPNEEEFEDTLTYIEKIRPKAEPYGICRIVPPSSWKPPCPLKEKDIWEKSKFATRVQRVDKLQNRDASRKMSNDNLMRKKRRRCSRMGVENGAGSVNIFEHGETVFGFEPGPEFTLDSFERYADDFKAQYFRRTENSTGPSEKWDPPVEIIESEYWRVVEKPTEEIEVLYGADLETGIFGSGFPKDSGQVCASSDEQYVKSGWNLNNLPLLPGSVLSYENASISGVQVPWLYVGMCFSSFCWHVEDHHLYSLNYMHFGAPKMWYGVPGKDAMRLEEAMRKHLPDLFEEQPDLLHKLITQLSPTILKSEGVPVYRCIQNAGEFVLTFPRAYHAGFNCGFNCAEAVNVAPVDWFPYGQNAVELYREQGRKTTISHDKLLLGAAREAVKAHWEINLLRKNTVENLKWKSVCGKDGVLAKSLKARVEKERASREHFCKSSKTMKMESNFDATRERECCLCFFDLHLSAAGCHCSPDRFSCLNHAKLWCACAPSEKYFLFRYDISELNLLVEAVEGKLSAIYRWAKLDLGLALSDCLSKNNKEVAGLMDSFSEHPEEKSQCRTTSLAPLNMKKEEGIENKPADLSSDISKMPNIQTDKRSDVVLALQATRVSPIKISLQLKLKNGKIKFKKEGNKLSASLVDGPDQKGVLCDQSSTEMEPTLGKSSHGHSDIICLDDEDDQLHEVPAYQTKGTNFPDCSSISKAVDCSGHKLNLSDLANAALAAEGNLSLTPPEEKDTHLSCSETPKDDKCDTPSASIEHNISRQQASTDSSSNIDRDGQRSNPESLPQNIATAPVVQLSNKVRDETVVHKGEVDLRIFPGSPSCSQNGLEKNYRPKGLRIAKVVRRINCCVEPLELGVVLSGNSWSNCQAIFPKGFKSRVRYIDFSDPTNMCYYISEIVDGGSKGPLFMVYLEHCSTEVFVHVTPKRCWEMVRERVNQEITKQHKLRKPMLPPLQPPGSLDGFEMFGFTSPSIVQAIEALDKNCVCTEYWKSRPLAKMSRCFQYREARQNIHSISEEANRAAGVDEVLRSLLKKANPEELKSLNELLSRERPAVDSSLVSRLLNEEIQSRPR